MLSPATGEELAIIDSILDISPSGDRDVLIALGRYQRLHFLRSTSEGIVSGPAIPLNVRDMADECVINTCGDRLHLHKSWEFFNAYTMEGQHVWTSDLPKGFAIQSIHYSGDGEEIYVRANYNNNIRILYYFIRITARTGKVIEKYLLDETIVDSFFSRELQALLCTDGSIMDARSGKIGGHFY